MSKRRNKAAPKTLKGTDVYLLKLRARAAGPSPSPTRVTLGDRIAKGGAAAIHSLDPPPPGVTRLAKMFHDKVREDLLTDHYVRRLVTYLQHHDALVGALPFVAWPDELVLSSPTITKSTFRDALLGFTMPRLDNVIQLHAILEQPAHQSFLGSPDAFVLASTIAAQLDKLHGHTLAFVFGDFNPRNILISKDRRRAAFIDADAYQLTRDKHVLTTQGVFMGYTSPLALANFNAPTQKPLTSAEDCFVLAILLFKLLLDGGHPFETGSQYPGQPTANDNIRARRFVYKDPKTFCGLPQTTDAFAKLPQPLQDAFHRAFTGPAPPTAADWVKLLHQARLPTPPAGTSPAKTAPPSATHPRPKTHRFPPRRPLTSTSSPPPAEPDHLWPLSMPLRERSWPVIPALVVAIALLVVILLRPIVDLSRHTQDLSPSSPPSPVKGHGARITTASVRIAPVPQRKPAPQQSNSSPEPVVPSSSAGWGRRRQTSLVLPPPVPPPEPEQGTTPQPGPAHTTTAHTVAPGETLADIARRYGLTVRAIVAFNNMADTALVSGLVLQIPANQIRPATPWSTTITPKATDDGPDGDDNAPTFALPMSEHHHRESNPMSYLPFK